MEKYYIKSNTNKRNGGCMSKLEKPIYMTQLAKEWGMSMPTLKKHFENLRQKHPEEECLRRKINGKAVIYPSDLPKIKECQI